MMGSKLISDIDLPLNVIDVSDCFKNCMNMKYVTSNWNKKYTYSLAHTDCYYNCINIETVDGQSAYLSGLPFDWGGHGFNKDNTGIYIVEIPNDNYIVNFGDIISDGTVEWGDGTYSHNSSTHKYEKSGLYTVQGKVYPNNSSLQPHSSLAQTLLNVNKLPNLSNNFESGPLFFFISRPSATSESFFSRSFILRLSSISLRYIKTKPSSSFVITCL